MWIRDGNNRLLNMSHVGAITSDGFGLVFNIAATEIRLASDFGPELLNEIVSILQERDSWRMDIVWDVKEFVQANERRLAELAKVKSVPEKPIDDCGFSSRTVNCLQRNEIRTLRDLARCSEDELWGIRNFGPMSLQEVRTALSPYGVLQ